MILPPSHPQRLELNDEVHARPPEALAAPLRLTYLALLTDPARRDASYEAICDLARRSAGLGGEVAGFVREIRAA